MTQATHTPGPWLAYPSNEPMQTNVGLPDSAIGHAIAFGNSQEEADANARLIAAAPDLLTALEHLLADAIALGIHQSEYSGVVIEARAAIGKATGAN